MMKKIMGLSLIVLTVVFFTPLFVLAQQGSPPATSSSSPQAGQDQGTRGMGGQHMQMCQQMMQHHEKMAADFKAMDDRLDQKIAAMNSAKGDQKIAAMSAVIAEMAAQRKERHQKMAAHRQQMCQMGQMGMMHGGGRADGGSGMGGCCPMMQQKQGMQGAPGQQGGGSS